MFFDGWAGPLRVLVVGSLAYVGPVALLRSLALRRPERRDSSALTEVSGARQPGSGGSDADEPGEPAGAGAGQAAPTGGE